MKQLIPFIMGMLLMLPIVSASFFDDFNYNTSQLYSAGWSLYNVPSMMTTLSVGNGNLTVQNICPIGFFCGFSGTQINSTTIPAQNDFYIQERYLMVTHISNQTNSRGFGLTVNTQSHSYAIVWNPVGRLIIQRDSITIFSNMSYPFIQLNTWYVSGIRKVGNTFQFYYEGNSVFNYTDSYNATDLLQKVQLVFGEYEYKVDWFQIGDITPPTIPLSCRICEPLNQTSYTWRFGCLMSNFFWCNSWTIVLIVLIFVGLYVYYKGHEVFGFKK